MVEGGCHIILRCHQHLTIVHTFREISVPPKPCRRSVIQNPFRELTWAPKKIERKRKVCFDARNAVTAQLVIRHRIK
jgi:hypothetical protein